MIHNFFLVGEIKSITVSPNKKDPSKGASAVLLLQYGKQRENTGNPVEFINAAMVRVPNYKYPKLADKLKVGANVTVSGHLQGVLKTIMESGYVTVELVADRIDVNGDDIGGNDTAGE